MQRSLVDVYRSHVQARGGQVAYRFINGQTDVTSLTFADVDRAARRIAASLRLTCDAGDRVLVLSDVSEEFVQAFFGCLYAGVIAVPLNLPIGDRGVAKIHGVARDARARLLLASAGVLRALDPSVMGMQALEIGALLAPDAGPEACDADLRVHDVAFLQYTSGSTGSPKGVIVSHANVLANEQMIRDSCLHGDDTVFVGWLPLFHDMGLVGNILQPAYLGIPSILMPPGAFIRRPRRWLELITDYRATTSGGPNFAYDTCVRRIRDDQLEGLDLRSWRIAFNGAEPIRAATLEAFARKFASAGFARRAFYPVYGLAEATLMVTAPNAGTPLRVRRVPADALEAGVVPPDDPRGTGDSRERVLVACGVPRGDQVVRIVHPETRLVLDEGEVGEIWVAGPNVAQGYWDDPTLTGRTFLAETSNGAGPFLRTGDLGFLEGGVLYVTGRMKDLLIVNGKNHYPQDLESTTSASDDAFAGRPSAAFVVEHEGGEGIAIAQEVSRSFLARVAANERVARMREVKAQIRRALAAEHELLARHVLLVPQGTLPLTTSGKIQRARCRSLFERGELPEIQTAPATAPTRSSSARAESSPTNELEAHGT